MTESEKCCVDVYMDYHVSEIKKEPMSVQKAWKEGQRIYNNRKWDG